MKFFLFLLTLIIFSACSNTKKSNFTKSNFKVKLEWNDNTKDVYLNNKHLKNREQLSINKGTYKLSWKYKKINTDIHNENEYIYFWKYKLITINSDSYFYIIDNDLKIKKGV